MKFPETPVLKELRVNKVKAVFDGIIAFSWSLKSIDAKTRDANVAELAIDVIRLIVTERLPGPYPHGKTGEDAYRREDRKRIATREGG